MQRSFRKRFKCRGVKEPQNQGEVPSWRAKLALGRLKAERAKKIPKHRMRRERGELEPKNRRQHGAVAPDGRNSQILRGAEPAKKFCHLRQRWTGDRMPVRVAPGTVNLPLKLVSLARGWSSRQGSLRSYSG